MQIPIITIDGDSGSGKGTLAHKLADHLKFHYLDSGAIYRIVAYAAQKHDWLDLAEDDFNQQVQALDIQFLQPDDSEHYLAYCEQENVSQVIRHPDISSLASQLSTRPSLRLTLLKTQQDFAQLPGLVTDGRDMGTVVFPEATAKLYLTADPEIRAKRRYKQLKDSDNGVSLADVEKKLNERDQRDKSRKVAPLLAAADALVIDSTELSVDEVFQEALAHISSKGIFSA
jgi:cytidylate kinase